MFVHVVVLDEKQIYMYFCYILNAVYMCTAKLH